MRLLTDGERNVTQITEELKIPPLNVSHHLTVLKHAKLNRNKKKGRFVIYSLCDGVLNEMVEAGVPKEVLNLGCCQIVLPTAAVQTLKHVGDRWALGLSFTWLATWVQRRATFWAMDDLIYTSSRRSYWTLNGFAARQLGDHFALALGAWANAVAACISPTCDWLTTGAGGSLRVVFRPWHWLTVGAGPYAGLRERTDATIPPPDPGAPTVVPPPWRVEWLGIAGSASVYW